LLGLVDDLQNRLVQLSLDFLGRVGLEDSRLRLHHLTEGPKRDPLAVRKRAAVTPGDEVGERFRMRKQLRDQAALADSRHADDGHE